MLTGIQTVSAMIIVRAGAGAKGLSLDARPLAQGVTEQLDPVANVYSGWVNEPPSADRVGRTRFGSMAQALSPALWADVFGFQRASTAYDTVRSGDWADNPTDQLRVDWSDDGRGTPLGWLIETARTNLTYNLRMEGAGAFHGGKPAILQPLTDGLGVINGFAVLQAGDSYTVAPTVVVGGPSGSGFAGTVNIASGVVTGVTITNGGTGYPVNPSSHVRAGTLPTGYGLPAASATAGTFWATSVVAVRTRKGLPQLVLRFVSVGTGGAWETSWPGSYAAVQNEIFTASFYAELIAGSAAGLNLTNSVYEFPSASGAMGQSFAAAFQAAPLGEVRRYINGPKTVAQATTTSLSPRWALSGIGDLTVGLSLPQTERGHYVSSPILSAPGVVSATSARGQEFLYILGNAFSQIFGAGASQGAVWMDLQIDQLPLAAVSTCLLEVNAGDGSNRFLLRLYTAGLSGFRVLGGAGSGGAFASAVVAGVPFRVAMAWKGGVGRFVGPAGTIGVASGGPLSGFTQLLIGYEQPGTQINGRVRGLYCAAKAPNDAKLIAASVLGADIEAILNAP